ncbi:Nudix family hydrolase [Dyella mobilis]|uniref:8-oxo-dGTP diphosphatase n=2 Tax=Dyella mobilis TaxID=1849582 RepID=A0ABS2KI97_9GAMM|nr:Nudix family hydrolase [Dyella mobilis]
MHVMAGVLRNAQGEVLLAQRPEGKHLAGSWEFPGGKLEPGEHPSQALARELREELGIQVDPADGAPLIRVPWRYGERGLLLDAWQFTRWQGLPVSLEGQALQWLRPSEVDLAMLAPADRPILQALRLPRVYAVTPADAMPDQAGLWQARIGEALEAGAGLIQLRFPSWSTEQVRELAASLQPQAQRLGAYLLLNRDIEGARRLGAGVGVHLKASQLAGLDQRPLPWTQWVGASCHDASELALAQRIGADFATLSPVLATASHPGAMPLGWASFQALAEAASLPVYALGGVGLAQIQLALENGAQGVAGIRGFW